MHGAFILNVVCVVLFLYLGLRRHYRDNSTIIAALYVLAWATLVLTAYILSIVNGLGNHKYYFATTVAISLLIATLFNLIKVKEVEFLEVKSKRQKFESHMVFIIASIVIILISQNIYIAMNFEPNNYDSVAYRFPRAFFYVGQGDVGQIVGDPRVQYYPFNLSLVYVWMAVYGLAGKWFYLFGGVSWLVGALVVWRYAITLGAQRLSAVVGALIYLTAPAVVISVTSTNDDLISGIPLLIGLLFLYRWFTSKSWIDAAMVGLSIGISAGAKLHFIMLLPVFILMLLIYFIGDNKNAFIGFIRESRGQSLMVATLIIFLSIPVFLINFLSGDGRITPDFAGLTNNPFSFISGFTHLVVSTASMLLGQVSDLYVSPVPAARHAVSNLYNYWVNNYLFWWVKPELNYSHAPFYFFSGVGNPRADLGVTEESVWVGSLTWILMISAILLCRRSLSNSDKIVRLLVFSFFLWHTVRCFTLRYVASEGIYYAYAVAFSAPALAWLLDYKATTVARRVSIIVLYLIVLCMNIITFENYFFYNFQRGQVALPTAVSREEVFSDDFKRIAARAGQINIVYNQWELPYFLFMTLNPKAKYSTEYNYVLPSNIDLSLLIARSEFEVPFALANDDRLRLAYIGNVNTNIGRQKIYGSGRVFSQGTELAANLGKDDFKYLLLQLSKSRNINGELVAVAVQNVFGLEAGEEFIYRIGVSHLNCEGVNSVIKREYHLMSEYDLTSFKLVRCLMFDIENKKNNQQRATVKVGM